MKDTREREFKTEARKYAKVSIESIREMVEAYDEAQTDAAREDAEQTIYEDPLEIQVRCNEWHGLNDKTDDAKPTEYYILLTTGGPAARIIGELDEYQQPKTARFEYQDWFKPWTEVATSPEQDKIMLKYAQHFYFGE